jgi:hypothetical protein
MRNPQEQAEVEAQSGTCARLSGSATCPCVSRIKQTCGGREKSPFSQENFISLAAPDPIHPRTVPAQHNENKAFLILLIFDASMETRNALKRSKVDVHLRLFGGGSGGRRDAATTDSDVEGLEEIREGWEDEAVVRADLVRDRLRVERGVIDESRDALGIWG